MLKSLINRAEEKYVLIKKSYENFVYEQKYSLDTRQTFSDLSNKKTSMPHWARDFTIDDFQECPSCKKRTFLKYSNLGRTIDTCFACYYPRTAPIAVSYKDNGRDLGHSDSKGSPLSRDEWQKHSRDTSNPGIPEGRWPASIAEEKIGWTVQKKEETE
jgi:hypothetical protein